MKELHIKVTDVVEVTKSCYLSAGEVNTVQCIFDLPASYDGMTVMAQFTILTQKLDKHNNPVVCENTVKRQVISGKCVMPFEAEEAKGTLIIGVIAYSVEGDELTKRYSPTPYRDIIHEGSKTGEYKDGGTVTPSIFEQQTAAMQGYLNEAKAAQKGAEDAAKNIMNETAPEVIQDAVTKYFKENPSAATTVTASNIKNALGYTPADAEDLSELSDKIVDVTENKADKTYVTNAILDVQTKDLTFVESVSEMTENTKNYVLRSTGEIWSLQKVTKSYTNQISISTDADGNVVGLIEGHRYNSSDALVTQVGTCATGFIPVKPGDVLRFRGMQFRNETIGSVTAGSYYMRLYDETFTLLSGLTPASMNGKISNFGYAENSLLTDEEGDMIEITISDNKITSSGYIRMAFVQEDGVDAVITVNEEIVETTIHKFLPTGRYYGTESLTIVSSTDEMEDTSKKYVLESTETIWRYGKFVTGYTNLANPTDENWKDGYRFSSTGESAQVGTTVSNAIPCKKGDVVRIKGVTLRENSDGIAVNITRPDTGETGYSYSYFNVGLMLGDAQVYNFDGLENDVYTFTILSQYNGTIHDFRFAMPTPEDASSVIVTVNEEIIETMVTGWIDTKIKYVGTNNDDALVYLEERTSTNENDIVAIKQNDAKLASRITALEQNKETNKEESIALPEYWEKYLTNKIAAIKSLQESGGKDCFSFPLITDIHVSVNLGKRSGLIAKRIMDECYMIYAICPGDVVTRGANKTKEQMEQSYEAAEDILKPIRDKLLQTQGNHDGSFGAEDLDGDGDVEGVEYYCYNYTPQKNHEKIYRKVSLVGNCHFDSTGTGYWIDDVSNKVRFIVFNSHCNKYEENEDGTAVYNNMRVFRLTQSQFDMAIEALTTVPSDEWAVLSFSHAPLNNRDGNAFADRIVMRDMLAAYRNKTTYTGSYGTSGDYDYVSVNTDFSSAKGDYVAHFSGHVHADTVTTEFGIPIITTRCDGHEENDSSSADGLYHERVAGTITEQSFDVFTINKSERKIYATKIGAGSDRVINY